MRKVILRDHHRVPPFGEYARDLRILNKVLWLYQRDVLARHCVTEVVLDDEADLAHLQADEELLVYRDCLFFNPPLMDEFVRRARASGTPCQIAFGKDDKAIANHVVPLNDSILDMGDHFRGELWYYPHGWVADDKLQPLVIDTEPMELGLYHVPDYLVQSGDFVYHVPLKAFIPIESWTHVMMANSLFGAFGWARRLLKDSDKLSVKLKVLLKAIIERKSLLSSSALVKVGRGCKIDSTAIIQGPTIIGNNVTIQAGTLIVSSIIGSNVNIMQGAQIVLSVVSDGCYIPFRAALYGCSMMENSMVAQNTIMQGTVVGRNTFIGGGVTFTDYNLVGRPIRTMHRGLLREVGMVACGCAVGHDCRIGAGFVFYPGRTVESGVVLPYEGDKAVVDRDVHWEDVAQHTTDRYARHNTIEEDAKAGWLWMPHTKEEVGSEASSNTNFAPHVTDVASLHEPAADQTRVLGEPISQGEGGPYQLNGNGSNGDQTKHYIGETISNGNGSNGNGSHTTSPHFEGGMQGGVGGGVAGGTAASQDQHKGASER